MLGTLVLAKALTIGRRMYFNSLELVRQKDRRSGPTVGIRLLAAGLNSEHQTGLQASAMRVTATALG